MKKFLPLLLLPLCLIFCACSQEGKAREAEVLSDRAVVDIVTEITCPNGQDCPNYPNCPNGQDCPNNPNCSNGQHCPNQQGCSDNGQGHHRGHKHHGG